MFSHAARLRWSGEIQGYDVRIEAIGGAKVEVGVPGGRELIGLVDAFLLGPEETRERARSAVIDVLGPEAMFDAATVFGNFEMMNRVAEGSGIGISAQRLEREADMVRALRLERIMKSQQRDH